MPVPPPLPPEAQQGFDKGVLAAQQQDFPLAIRYFEEARKIAPYNPDLLFNLALAESKIPGREARAIARFRAYLLADPDSAKAAQIGEQLKILEVRLESSVSKLIGSGKDLANQYSESYPRNSALESVAEAQAETGDIAGAKETVGTISSDNRGSALWKIVKVQMKAGDVEGAKATIRAIDDGYWQGVAWVDLAEMQTNKGDYAAAESALSNVSYNQKYPQERMLVSLAKVYVKKGDTAGAWAALARARDSITQRKKPGDYLPLYDSPYYEVACAQAAAGDIQGTLQTIPLITPQGQNNVFDYIDHSYQCIDSYYQDAGNKLLEKGDIQGAIAMVGKMTGHGNYKANLQSSIGGKVYEQFKEKIKAHDVIGAQQLAALIPDRNNRCDAYRDLTLQALNDRSAFNSLMPMIACHSSKGEVYAAMGDEEKKAGNIARARQLYIAARDEVAQVPIDTQWSWNNRFLWEVFIRIATSQAQAGDLQEALQTASKVGKDAWGRGGPYKAVASIQLENGDFEGARRTADLLSGSSDRADIYQSIAIKHAQAGNFMAAGLIASMIPADSYSYSYAYRDISGEQANRGDFVAAKQTAAVVRDKSAQSSAYSAIADKQAALGDFAAALETAALIPDADSKDSEYKSIGARRLSMADFAGAATTFEMIAGLPKRAEAYRDYVYYWTTENLDSMKQRMDRSHQITVQITDPVAQSRSCGDLANNWLYLNDVAQARLALAEGRKSAFQIKDPEKRADAYAGWYLFDKYADTGEWAAAEESIWLAVDSAMAMEPGWSQSGEFDSLASKLAKHFDYAGAKELVYQIKDEGRREQALTSLAGVEVDQRNFRLARRDMAEIKDKDRRDGILIAILRRQLTDKDLSAASQTFTELTTTSNKNEAAYLLADAYVTAKDLASAREWAKRADLSDSRTYYLCSGFAGAGDITWGQNVVDRIKDLDYRNWCLREIGKAQAKVGNIEDAKRTALLVREKDRGSVIGEIAGKDPEWAKARFADTPAARWSIFTGIVNAGDIGWALQNVSVFSGSERDSAFSSIVSAQAKKGDFAGAKGAAGFITNKRDRAYAFTTIADQQVKAQDLTGAIETLKLARETYGGLGADFDSWAGYKIALAQKPDTTKQDPVAITAAMATARSTAAAIKDPYWRSVTYLLLASGNEATGPDLLALIPEPLIRSRGYATEVRNRVAKGDLATAIKLAGSAPDPEYKHDMYATIVIGALATSDLSRIMPLLAALPDGAAKAYMYLHLAKLQNLEGNPSSAATLLASAQKATAAMASSFAKARAFAEISKAAAESPGQLSQDASRLAATTGRALAGDEQQRWASYLNPGAPAAGEKSQPGSSTRTAAQNPPKKKIDAWETLISDEFSKPLFTGFQAYVQSLSGRSSSGEILGGVLQAVRDLMAALEKEKKLDAEQRQPKTIGAAGR